MLIDKKKAIQWWGEVRGAGYAGGKGGRQAMQIVKCSWEPKHWSTQAN